MAMGYSMDNNSWLVPSNWTGKLQKYYGLGVKLLHCPSEQKPVTGFYDVDYGSDLDRIIGDSSYWDNAKYRMTQIEAKGRSDTTVYFMDSYSSGSISYYTQHVIGYAQRLHWGGYRHNDCLNVLWVDQHSSFVKTQRLADSNSDGSDDDSYFNWTRSAPPKI